MGENNYKVEVHNLTKNFGSLKVLNDISFNIKKGEFVCIVGPTGCGKTTFLNLLTRIYMPTKGDLLIDGESADPKKHNLAFVFQEPSALPWKTVEQNLRFGLELKKLPEKEQNESGIIRWMRFLGAKSRKEFEKMAKEDTYIDEAYEMLKHRSADEKKRLEYEAREKAIRDYNSQMLELKEVGRKEGIAIGAEQGEQRKAASYEREKVRKKLQI